MNLDENHVLVVETLELKVDFVCLVCSNLYRNAGVLLIRVIDVPVFRMYWLENAKPEVY